jgi:hypothetical protein
LLCSDPIAALDDGDVAAVLQATLNEPLFEMAAA